MSAEDVRRYLRPLLAQRDRERKEALKSGEWQEYDEETVDTSHTGSYGRGKHTPLLGGSEWLAARTGYDSSYVIKLMSSTRGPRYFTLHLADALLSGAGLSDLLDNGTIPIVPNPYWTQAKWEDWRDLHCDPELPDILS